MYIDYFECARELPKIFRQFLTKKIVVKSARLLHNHDD